MGKNLRLICMAFVATLAVALCACGGPDPASGITFRNATDDIDVAGFYISSTTSDNWGEHCNSSTVKAGSETVIDDDVLVDGAGVAYDVAAYDGESMIYEFYEVTLDTGYTIDFVEGTGTVDPPTLTVTDAAGGTQVYEGYASVHVG